jgi:hypothetical protein
LRSGSRGSSAPAEQIWDDLAELVDKVIREAAPLLVKRRAACELVQRVIAAADTYKERHDVYDIVTKAHAAAETQRLWRPFHVWRIRYAPVGAVRSGDDDLVEEVYSLTDPKMLVCAAADLVEVNQYSGLTKSRVIGAMLDAVPMDVGKGVPDVNGHSAFYHRYLCGRWTINVPPMVTDEPVPLAIATVPNFGDWLRMEHGMDVGGDLDVDDVIARGPEAIDLNRITPYDPQNGETSEDLPF